MNEESAFTPKITLAIVLLYAISGVILFFAIGPWEAVRNVAVEGLILFVWLWSARRILRDVPVPASEPIRYPVMELAIAIGLLALAAGIAAVGYANLLDIPSWVLPAVMCGGVLILFISLGYSKESLGLKWPSRRAWLALLAVIGVNFAAAALFQILPEGEAEPVARADLSNQITGPWTFFILLVSILLGAALPEELLLRVTLQPRLAQFMTIGWAILAQALLFSAAHLPQKVIGYQETWMIAIGSSLVVNNGLIGGYLWWRTRSLPLLLLLHLFAYPRLGV